VMRIDGWEAVAPGERSGGLDRTRICDLLRVKQESALSVPSFYTAYGSREAKNARQIVGV